MRHTNSHPIIELLMRLSILIFLIGVGRSVLSYALAVELKLAGFAGLLGVILFLAVRKKLSGRADYLKAGAITLWILLPMVGLPITGGLGTGPGILLSWLILWLVIWWSEDLVNQQQRKWWQRALLGLAVCVWLIGTLFKILSWAGGNELLLSGVALGIVYLLVRIDLHHFYDISGGEIETYPED